MNVVALFAELAIGAGLLHALERLDALHGVSAAICWFALRKIVLRIRLNVRQTQSLVSRSQRAKKETVLQRLKWAGICSCVGTFIGVTAIDGSEWVSLAIRGMDRDRAAIEKQLAEFESAGAWQELIKAVESRLECEASADWSTLLRHRQQQAFLHVGLAERMPQAQKTLDLAVDHASAHGLDPLAGRTLAEFIRQNDDLRAELTRSSQTLEAGQQACWAKESQSKQQLQAAQEQLQAAEANRQALSVTHQERQKELVQEASAMLLTSADGMSEWPQRQLEILQAAKSFGDRHGLETSGVEARISSAKAAHAAIQPAALPAGTTAAIRAVRADSSPPALVVELTVTDRQGMHVVGLTSKDFSIVDRNPIPHHATFEVIPTATPLQLAFAFDVSASMKGPALVAAKQGAQSLMQKLSGRAEFRLIAFSDGVRDLSAWTSNVADASRTLDPLQADGGTALLQAISRALELVISRPGPKAILVFTDGKDTEKGVDLQNLIERCRQQQVAVHFIALARPDLDLVLINQVTSETGGTFVSANQESELAQQFLQIAKHLHAKRYRLAVLGHNGKSDLTIRIGGERSIELRVGREAMAATAGR